MCQNKGQIHQQGGNTLRLSMFDSFMDIGVLLQGAATEIMGEPIAFFYV